MNVCYIELYSCLRQNLIVDCVTLRSTFLYISLISPISHCSHSHVTYFILHTHMSPISHCSYLHSVHCSHSHITYFTLFWYWCFLLCVSGSHSVGIRHCKVSETARAALRITAYSCLLLSYDSSSHKIVSYFPSIYDCSMALNRRQITISWLLIRVALHADFNPLIVRKFTYFFY